MAADDASPALELRSLSRSFGALRALSDVSLTLAPGERLGLAGPNGSGKTTLMRCVVGTLTPSNGEALVFGHPAGSLAARRLIGCSLAQERSFYLRLTGTENLKFFGRVRGLTRAEVDRRLAAIAEELELQTIVTRRVDRCSTGMTQQLAIARALMAEPQLLLVDEPTRSLDDAAVERFWAAIDRRPDMAVVIASHRHEDLDHCGKRLTLGS